MRLILTTLLTIFFITAFGQDKKLWGKYTHSFFMYEYFLTLSDSGQFYIEESTDLGKSLIVGNWINNENQIVLSPTRGFKRNQQNEIFQFPKELLEPSVILIDRERRLTIINQNKEKKEFYVLKKID